jgi:hypothetical protein
MAKGKKSESRGLDVAGARAMIKAFTRTTDRDAYSASLIPDTPEYQRILALGIEDQRVVVCELVIRLGDLSKRDAKAKNTVCYSDTLLVKECGMPLSHLAARLLRRNITFTPQEVLRMFETFCEDPGFCRSVLLPGMIGALARLPAPVDDQILIVAKRCLASIRTQPGAQSARLAASLSGSLEKFERDQGSRPKGGRKVTPSERVLLNRGTIKDSEPMPLDAMLQAVSVPEENDAAGAVKFACPKGAPRKVIDAINALLASALSRRERRNAIKLDADPSVGSVAIAAGGPGVVWLASALAAMSQRQIKFEFDDKRAERFNKGFDALLSTFEFVITKISGADASSLASLCHALSRLRVPEFIYPDWGKLAEECARLISACPSPMDKRTLLHAIRLRERLARTDDAMDRASARVLDAALNIGADFPLDLGERWSDQAFTDLIALKPAERAAWVRFIEHGQCAKGGAPSAKWCKQADELAKSMPRERVEEFLGRWFLLVGKPRPAIAGGKIAGRDPSVPTERGADGLRSLALMASLWDTPASARALGDLAMACFKMVPGVGARCIRPGTAALWGLSLMTTPSALAQLSRLRQLVKFGTAKKMLDASLANLAARLGVTTSELHEMACPDFGLEADGSLRQEAGDFTLELVAGTGGAEVRVLDSKGAVRKTIPDVVKKEHAEPLKALKQTRDDIDKMLQAQRARIDSMFVDDRCWSVSAWIDRYIRHPLVGVLGRRLIWRIVDDVKSASPGRAVLWRDDRGCFADLHGKSVTPADTQYVRLWHPIDATSDEVRAWRDLIEKAGLRQPVKQAHREVYPLTDAERATGTYSNRFAAHILKQHAFQQLAADRGWKSKLRLMVDAEYPPPSRDLGGWAIRAEFWIETVGDDFGVDTTDSGSFLYVATDQVRFYRAGAAELCAHAGGGGYAVRGEDREENRPIPLESIPPIVFSEMMRDCDLFVGGASVGNNPGWQDGGPEGRFLEYWHEFSFGELAGSGRARHEMLERLIPRLRIAGVCELAERFLRVKGRLRSYKIHLGSGNILMEPNDQYLCIVPSAGQAVSEGSVFLPFEGDRTLSIILSKAFLLAEDDKIKDQSIVRQIKRK